MSLENILRRIGEETDAAGLEALEKAKSEAARIRERYERTAEKLRGELAGRAGEKAEEEDLDVSLSRSSSGASCYQRTSWSKSASSWSRKSW